MTSKCRREMRRETSQDGQRRETSQGGVIGFHEGILCRVYTGIRDWSWVSGFRSRQKK